MITDADRRVRLIALQLLQQQTLTDIITWTDVPDSENVRRPHRRTLAFEVTHQNYARKHLEILRRLVYMSTDAYLLYCGLNGKEWYWRK